MLYPESCKSQCLKLQSKTNKKNHRGQKKKKLSHMSTRESTDGSTPWRSLAGLWPWPSHYVNSFWLLVHKVHSIYQGFPLGSCDISRYGWKPSVNSLVELRRSVLVRAFMLWHQVKQAETPWTAQHRGALDFSKRFPESLSDQRCPDKKSKWESCPLPQGPMDRTGARGSSSLAMLSCWCQKTRGAEVRLQGCAEPSCGEAERARAGRTDSAKGMPAKWRAVLAHRTGKEGHGRIGSTRKIWWKLWTLSSDKPSSNPNWPF